MKRNLIFGTFAVVMGIGAAVCAYGYHYFYPDNYIQLEDGSYQNIATAKEQTPFPINSDTVFTIEHYDKETDRILTEEVKAIPALLGCDKEGVERYLTDYMRHLSKEEQEKGLVSYVLTSYQGNHLYFRKTYEQPIYHGYYAKSFNGLVVIMNGDGKTVYDYTQIPIHLLPEDVKEAVMQGYYLENEQDLYNFLENYSS